MVQGSPNIQHSQRQLEMTTLSARLYLRNQSTTSKKTRKIVKLRLGLEWSEIGR